MELIGLSEIDIQLGFDLPDGSTVVFPCELPRKERIEKLRELLELYPPRMGGTGGD